MPRYSVDVDLTYIPVEERGTSLQNINGKLLRIGEGIRKAVPDIKVKPVPSKLLCTLGTISVKIEVNVIQRGIIGETIELPLCERAKAEFELFCKARTVSVSQLYGGKIGAALNRQHPRDLFDFKYMEIHSFDEIRMGLIYNMLSSPKPVVELLSPNPIDQSEALENQFRGMTDMPFSYTDYEQTRQQLIDFVNGNLSPRDRDFLVSYEEGNPFWADSEYPFSKFPSIQWKQLNINRLSKENPAKYKQGIEKLKKWLYK
jgi:hypothetical protein